MIHGLSEGAENKSVFSRGERLRGCHDFPVKTWSVLVGWVGIAFLAMAEDEASWPRKPDSRMSALSGKMKEISEISPRFYGQDKEFRGKEAGEWQKEAKLGSRGNWESPAARGWEGVRWNQSRDWSGVDPSDEKFQPQQGLASEKTKAYRELEKESAPDWSSRPASLGARTDGSLRMYEGRLTRIREQVSREEQNPRDLGPGRQEKFSPEEVEKMLSQPAAEGQGVKGRSPTASPPAAAGN